MARRSPKATVSKSVLAVHEQISSKKLQTALEVSDSALSKQNLLEIVNMLWVGEDESEETKHKRLIRALQLYESLEPADGAEGMLAMQMVGTHDAALECLRRAAIPSQTFAGRDMSLKHAHKLMTLYTQQLATLNKHRGKGQQKVTVEHVNVEAGGQAIVGNVSAGAPGRRTQDKGPPSLEHNEQPTLDTSTGKVPSKTRKS